MKTSRIRPGVPAPAWAARIGSQVLHRQAGVSYRELRSRSLVNRCDAPERPFEWTVNPYRGCAVGCRYCYATYTHGFMGITDPEDFHATVFAKTDDRQETVRGLAKALARGERVALGTATDPYQPAEARLGITRRFLETALAFPGLKLSLVTKSALVLRDLELLRQLQQRAALSVAVSLISWDAALLRRLEPWAPPPAVRLEVLRRLVTAGIRAVLFIAPVLPGLTDGEAHLDRLLRRARAAGVRRIGCNVLFLRSPTRERYLRFVATEFPRLLTAYQRAYARGAYLDSDYRQRVQARIAGLARVHGLEWMEVEPLSRPVRQQLSLWSDR